MVTLKDNGRLPEAAELYGSSSGSENFGMHGMNPPAARPSRRSGSHAQGPSPSPRLESRSQLLPAWGRVWPARASGRPENGSCPGPPLPPVGPWAPVTGIWGLPHPWSPVADGRWRCWGPGRLLCRSWTSCCCGPALWVCNAFKIHRNKEGCISKWWDVIETYQAWRVCSAGIASYCHRLGWWAWNHRLRDNCVQTQAFWKVCAAPEDQQGPFEACIAYSLCVWNLLVKLSWPLKSL